VLVQLADIVPAALEGDQHVKTKALTISKQLTAFLDNPMNRATHFQGMLHLKQRLLTVRISLTQHCPFSGIGIRMAASLKLFDHISAATGAITSAELSRLSGGEEVLICKVA
jgi:hypothetical protein